MKSTGTMLWTACILMGSLCVGPPVATAAEPDAAAAPAQATRTGAAE